MPKLCSGDEALAGVLLLEHHKRTIHQSKALLALVPSLETDLSGSPLTLSIDSKTDGCCVDLPGSPLTLSIDSKTDGCFVHIYVNTIPQLFSLFGKLEPSFFGKKSSISICS